jgi:hypothetical protein
MPEPQQIVKLAKWTPKFKRGDYFSMIICASRNSGKSYLIKDLIRNYLRAKYDVFIVVSDSGDTESDLAPVLPADRSHFWTEMNYAAITVMEGRNKERAAEGKQPLSMLIVFDDKVSVRQRSDDRLMQLFTRGRHMHLSIIFSTQSKKFADTGFLNNADYVLLLKANSRQQQKTLIDNVLKGTAETPDGVNENKYFEMIIRQYMSNVGDVVVIDCKKGTNGGLLRYRAD